MDIPRPAGDPLPPALAAYFAAVDEGRFEDAIACFTPGVLYAVPQPGAAETAARVIRRGHAELRAHFVARGTIPLRHRITLCAVSGPHVLVEGVAIDANALPLLSFVASVHCAGDGLIERYLAFACGPAVP